jgi:hypothetical protein
MLDAEVSFLKQSSDEAPREFDDEEWLAAVYLQRIPEELVDDTSCDDNPPKHEYVCKPNV